MPPVLNSLGVKVACIGNHDFDFGGGQCQKLCNKCNFPWLAANIKCAKTGGMACLTSYAVHLYTNIYDVM